MMRNITVTGGYADFKTVVGVLGKPKAVFWWRSGAQDAQIAALLEDWTVVHVTVPKPEAPAPVALPVEADGPPSPFVAVKAGAQPDAKAKPELKVDAGPGPGLGKPALPATPPKTVLETDFPGAIEVQGRGIVFF